ncbi:MAG: hypothetical protein WDN08_00905 [Rhizomicrobium sp.]
MKLSRIVFTAALLLASAVTLEGAMAADPPASDGRGAMRGYFSPEERLMLFADSSKATAGMTDDQKHAYRDQRRAQFMAMSEADRAKMKADLAARWAALPADQKAALTAQMEARRAARANGGGTGQ